MRPVFDVVVIGAGPGGYVAAIRAAQKGAAVAVVEKGQLGGTCLNFGCIPSKALLASAELLHRIRGAGDLGVRVAGGVGFDWPAIQKRKDKTLQTLRGGIEGLFKAGKIALHRGEAMLEGPGKVVVKSDDGGSAELAAGKIILAVGSAPARIAGWPDEPGLVCTSDEALHWRELPGRLLIVGGGVIGCEFACMLQAFGVEVTIVEMMPSLLPELDEDLGAEIKKVLEKRGIKCLTDTKVQDLRASGPAVTVALSDGLAVEANKVLVATGRTPNTDGIGLESLGLETDRGFVRVNDRMETSAAGVYCIGDANGRCLLAHAASAQGVVAAENALGASREFDSPVPNCVYTFPELASVGITRQEARAKGIAVSVGAFPMSYLGKAMAVGQTEGFVKVIRNRQDDRLLGVHMMGHNVTECIAAVGAMLHQKLTTSEMAEVIVAHPTIGEAWKEAAEDALGAAIHLPPRKTIRVSA